MSKIFVDLVDFFGGQSATAKALGVTQGTVSGWVRGVHGCSADIALKIQTLTEGSFSARDLRPSLAGALPTMDLNLLEDSTAHQSTVGSVHPSSITQASP